MQMQRDNSRFNMLTQFLAFHYNTDETVKVCTYVTITKHLSRIMIFIVMHLSWLF